MSDRIVRDIDINRRVYGRNTKDGKDGTMIPYVVLMMFALVGLSVALTLLNTKKSRADQQ